MSRANANANANAEDARDVDAGTSRARALEATLESARDAVATRDGVTAFAEASIVNSRDVSDVRARETKEHERESAREASAALPTPRWDPSEEAANKERLPFNPRARGLVGKKTDETPRDGPASPR